MQFWEIIFTSPFTWGLALGLFFVTLLFWQNFKLKMLLNRQSRMVGEKMQIEAENWGQLKSDLEKLRKENENLRIKIADCSRTPERRLAREFEILARAEKKMILSAPGFAPAWEIAKSEAQQQLEEEDQGKSLPRQIFSRLLSRGRDPETKSLESTHKVETFSEEAQR
ncbi:MAG: hypothetical protein ACFCU3_11800 [Verrucomicrobiales bacterium]